MDENIAKVVEGCFADAISPDTIANATGKKLQAVVVTGIKDALSSDIFDRKAAEAIQATRQLTDDRSSSEDALGARYG
ncbi:hypothetical protein CHU98_g8423 [Xylaria longipes]|nr:hypothetical protein CHU98_g8423 [Xylaria longipes]